jgi:hypothetical protein
MLRVERAFGGECLLAALEEAHEPGGVGALLMALRHIYQAEGLKDV